MSKHVSGGFIGSAAIYVVAAVVNAGIPFLLLPLIARWLGPADFGVIGSFVAIVNVLILLVGLNAYGFVSVSFYRDGPETLPPLAGAAVAIILVASLIVGLAVALGASAIERSVGIDRGWLWTLLAAATGQAVVAVGLTVAQTLRRPLAYAAMQISYGLALALLAVVLVGAWGMGWEGRALAQALAALGIAAAALAWLRSTGRLTVAMGRANLSRALNFGIPLLPHSFAAVAMGSMDRLALGATFGPATIGQYFLALQIASAFTALAAAVNQAWVPWLYERLSRGDAASRGEIEAAARSGGLVLIAAACVLALLAEPIVLLVGGSSYAPATLPLRFLAFHAAGQAWYMLMSAFLFYAERTRLLSTLTICAAVLQAALIAILVPRGATGVAAALAAGSCVAAIAMSLFALRGVRGGNSSPPSVASTQPSKLPTSKSTAPSGQE